jgi:UTP-glucose-1-phosphate uridylyltransferase
VGLARTHVGCEPFLVLDPQRFLVDDRAVLAGMLAAHHRSGLSAVALAGRPDLAHADPDDFARAGRYLFTSDVFAALDAVREGHPETEVGELLGYLAHHRALVVAPARREPFDLGDPMDRLAVELELLLADPQRGVAVAALVARLANRTAWDAA